MPSLCDASDDRRGILARPAKGCESKSYCQAKGEQEQSAYNGYFGSVCYHPLFLFISQEDCLAAKLRPGNVHSAEGLSNQAVARELRITGATVGKWRERFRTARLPGLADEPRPGAPREISAAQVEDLITRTLESPPPYSGPW